MPFTLVSRKEWTPVKGNWKKWDMDETMKTPVHAVFLTYYTRTPACHSSKECKPLLRKLLHHHMNQLDYSDIKYNFLIGGDGSVYEGRGWFKKPFKDDQRFVDYSNTVDIALIGDYKNISPPEEMLTAAQSLIQYGVSCKFIHITYEFIENRTDTIMPFDPGYMLAYADEHKFELEPY